MRPLPEPICRAVKQASGEMRCALCRLAWDADDQAVCGKKQESPPLVPEPFVSALAPALTFRF
jgi:hypothetical protein